MYHEALEWELSYQRKGLYSNVPPWDEESTENLRNFPGTPGIITLIRNTGNNLKVWDHLAEYKDAFPKLQMAQIESPKLKKLAQFCSGRVLVLLHLSLYRALNLTFLIDLGGIITKGRITSDVDTESLGQSVAILNPTDFCPVCV